PDLPVAQAVVNQGEQSAGGGDHADVRARAVMIRARSAPSLVPGRVRWQASIAAHRTSFEPCFVIGPRCTVVSDSRWRGVKPAHDVRCRAEAKRGTSPISATKNAASTGPTP